MAVEEAAQAPHESPAGGTPPARGLFRRLHFGPLQIGYASVFALLTASAAALTVLGNPADGGSFVSLKLTAFSGTAPDKDGARPLSFVGARSAGDHLVSDPALIEDAPEGPLSAIGNDGRMPMSAYARAFDRNDKRPKIAIVVTGLDVSVGQSADAIARLPADVSLSFTPFASDVQSWIDKARYAGHEALLEVPMEPFDFPDSDPGPHALLVGASAEENVKRLHWAMARATGYVGLANILGGRFMGERDAIEPVLDDAAKRGLLFFDTGASATSITLTAARHARAAIATGTLTLDGVQTQAAIDTKLADLEAQAHQDSYAIGVASTYPISIARIAEWAANAEARGFRLVTVSAFAKRPPDAAEEQPTASAE
jgi:polysaccharide deacetylase 2 family uncharacterized protein YibQ